MIEGCLQKQEKRKNDIENWMDGWMMNDRSLECEISKRSFYVVCKVQGCLIVNK